MGGELRGLWRSGGDWVGGGLGCDGCGRGREGFWCRELWGLLRGFDGDDGALDGAGLGGGVGC